MGKNVWFYLIIVYGSKEYVFVEQDYAIDKNKDKAYLKRNYNPKTPLLLKGYDVHGYTIENGELSHVVATDPSTNELYVMIMAIKSITR